MNVFSLVIRHHGVKEKEVMQAIHRSKWVSKMPSRCVRHSERDDIGRLHLVGKFIGRDLHDTLKNVTRRFKNEVLTVSWCDAEDPSNPFGFMVYINGTARLNRFWE